MINTLKETDNSGVDIKTLLKPLSQNFLSIILITSVILLASVVYAYFLKSIYTSSVTLAFPNSETKQVRSILPNKTGDSTDIKEKLERISLILQTPKFIKLVVKNLEISQCYYIEKNYKKNAVYNFKNLSIDLQIHHQASDTKNLYGTFFQISPINKKQFLLSIDELEYSKIHYYNRTIHTKYFTLKATKNATLSEKSYFVTKVDQESLVDEILSNMSTSVVFDNMLKIEYNDVIPKRAKEIVEEIANNFKAYTLKEKQSEVVETLKFLNDEINKIKSVMKSEGDALNNYQTQGNTFRATDSNRISLLQTITNKEELVKELKLKLNELMFFKNRLKQGNFDTIALSNSAIELNSLQSFIERFQANEVELNEMEVQKNNIEKSITKNQKLEQLIDNLNTQKKLLEDLRFNFTEQYPDVKKASTNVIKIQNSIMSYIDVNIKKLKKNQFYIKNKILHNIVIAEKNIKNRMRILKKDINAQKKLLQTFPERELDIQKLKRNLSLSEKTYTHLLEKRMELGISLNSTIANVQIIENAKEPQSPTKPNKVTIVIIGFIFGVIGSIISVFLKVTLDTKVRDIDSIQRLTNIPVYGSLPSKKNKNFFNEALRGIRTNLEILKNSKKNCTTILVSSNVSGEGKTTVITGLGMILSKSDKKVLLLDLDLRKPRLHQELNQPNTKGMSQYLATDIELSKVMQHIDANLDFISAGAIPDNPSELLMSKKFKRILTKLSQHYDYILFDTPPIGSVIDANTLLEYSDIVLWVVRANVSNKNFIEKVNDLKAKREIDKLGIILNDLKENQIEDYSYGYNYNRK